MGMNDTFKVNRKDGHSQGCDPEHCQCFIIPTKIGYSCNNFFSEFFGTFVFFLALLVVKYQSGKGQSLLLLGKQIFNSSDHKGRKENGVQEST